MPDFARTAAALPLLLFTCLGAHALEVDLPCIKGSLSDDWSVTSAEENGETGCALSLVNVKTGSSFTFSAQKADPDFTGVMAAMRVMLESAGAKTQEPVNISQGSFFRFDLKGASGITGMLPSEDGYVTATVTGKDTASIMHTATEMSALSLHVKVKDPKILKTGLGAAATLLSDGH